MAIKGDTMIPGNVISTADAQKINQSILGQYVPSGFDYYTMDVNGTDGTISIADVYSVYGRLAGRFSSWPNSKKDVMFFTVAEYDAINGATANLTSTYSTINNLTYSIDGKDSITYYVAVKGDANATGFKMARLTPIKITNPVNAKNYIIDNSVQYDDVTETIEVNMPKVKVDEGNLVNVPVKMLTNGKQLGAVQLELKYDTALLEFKKIDLTEKMMNWTSYTNPSDGVVAFGAADLKGNLLVNDGEDILVMQFIAKKPQSEWGTAAIWTGPKYVGGDDARDMNITPAMGVIEVRRINKPVKLTDLEDVIIFPNPNQGEVMVQFRVDQESETEVSVSDLIGRKVMEVVNTKMPAGEYKYLVNLTRLENGFYLMSVKTDTKISTSKIIINK